MTTETTPKFQIEWGKLALIGLLMMGGFVLMGAALLADVTDARFTAIVAIGTTCITAPAGYLFGNGRLASKGEQSIPTLAPHPERVAAVAAIKAQADVDELGAIMTRLQSVINDAKHDPTT